MKHQVPVPFQELPVRPIRIALRYSLHRYVRVRRGSLDERLPFDWPIAGEELLYPILVTAERQGRPVEIVLGEAPDWKNPWATAQRGYVSQFRFGIFRFQEGPMIQTLDCADVQAARWLSY